MYGSASTFANFNKKSKLKNTISENRSLSDYWYEAYNIRQAPNNLFQLRNNKN
jgi:hypothetical protein